MSRKLLGLLLILGLAGCAAPSSNVDYNTEIDFAAINQYQLAEAEAEQDPLMAERIAPAIQANLDGRGWRQGEQGVRVFYRSRVETREKESNVSVGVGGGTYGRRGSVSGSVAVPLGPTEEQVMILQIDLVQDGALIWRATDDMTLPERERAERRTERVQNLVAKMLGQFPPKP